MQSSVVQVDQRGICDGDIDQGCARGTQAVSVSRRSNNALYSSFSPALFTVGRAAVMLRSKAFIDRLSDDETHNAAVALGWPAATAQLLVGPPPSPAAAVVAAASAAVLLSVPCMSVYSDISIPVVDKRH